MEHSSIDLGLAHVGEESSPKKGDENYSGKTYKESTIDEIADPLGASVSNSNGGMVDQCLSEPLAHDITLDNNFVRG